MRADIEQRVWQAKCAANIRSWKFVLLNLCSHANQEGEAFPGVSTIVKETGYSKKAVIDALEGLEARGIIKNTGKCGEKNRVDIYNILGALEHADKLGENVDKSGNGEVSSPFNGVLSSVNGVLSSVNGELSSKSNGELSSGKKYIYNNRKLVSKLVRMPGNSEVSSPFIDKSNETTPGEAEKTSGRLPKQEAKTGVEAGGNFSEAGKFFTEHTYHDWKRLFLKDGFKPTTREGRIAAEHYCYEMGANVFEAARFGEYNACRKWNAISMQTNVKDLVRGWIRKWRKDDPDGYLAEINHRREQKRNQRGV